MGFPTTSLLDDFNRADGGLGANWTAAVESGDSTPTIVSNAWSIVSSFGTSYWSNASFNADQEVYADVTNANTHRFYLRIGGGKWYRLEIDYSYSPDQAEIRYWDGAGYTTVATASGNIASAQAFGFEAIGTSLKGYVKIGGVWSVLVSGTDSNITGGGNIGIGCYSSTLDNFSGGNATVEEVIENDRPPYDLMFNSIPDHTNFVQAISRSSDGAVVLRNGDATTMSLDIEANARSAQQYYEALKAFDNINDQWYRQTLDGEEVALDGPVAYWGMGEYGGVRRSSVDGEQTVVDGFSEFTNTSAADAVASDNTSSPTGRRYAVLTSSAQSYLEKPQDANLTFSGAPFSGVVLVRMDSLSQDQFIATQTVFGGNRGWQCYYSNSSNRFIFGMSTDGTAMNTVTANTFGAPSTATWYTIDFGWDGSSIWIRVNGGARDTSAVGSAMFNTTAAVRIGYRDGLPLDGAVAALGLWKRAITDGEISAIYNSGTYTDPIPVVTPASLWNADFEVGTLDEWNAWPASSAEQNNGTVTSASSTTYARSGTKSWRATIDTTGNTGADTDGVRLFRSLESQARTDTYHEAYFYMPATITPETPDFWNNVMQFKSNNGTTTDPFWYVSINNRGGGAMYLRLFKWQATQRWYEQTLVDLPPGQWVKISARYIQASGSTGRVIFWQDDVLIFDIPSVPTIYSGTAGPAQWSINNYSAKTQPNPAIIHFDDAAIYDPSQAGIITSDPVGVTASSPASGQIQVDWTALGDASSYAVYISTSSREYTTQYAAASNTKLITGLGDGTYYVYVVGINASGKYSGASAETSVVVGTVITGSSIKTLSSITGSIAGTVDVSGSSIQTLPNITGAVAGTVDVVASSTKTLSNITGSVVGTVDLVASSAQPIGSITGSATAQIIVGASSTQSVGAITGSASGVIDVSGTSSQSIGLISGSVAGTVSLSAASTVTIAAITGSVVGTVDIVASSSKATGNITGSAAGTVANNAQSTVTLSNITGSVVGTVDITATSNKSIGTVSGSAVATIEVNASSTKTLSAITGSSAGVVDVAGSSNKTISTITGSVSGTVDIVGSSSQSIGTIVSSTQGTVDVTATSTNSIGLIAGTVAGTVALVGSSNVTLSAITGSVVGAVEVVATSAKSIGVITGSTLGTVDVTAQSSQSVGNITGTIEGIVGFPPVEAISDITLSVITGSAAAQVEVTAASTKSVGSITGSISGQVDVVASSSKTLSAVTGSIVGTVDLIASSSKSIGQVTGTVNGTVLVTASSNQSVGVVTGSAAAQVGISAQSVFPVGNISGSSAGTVDIVATSTQSVGNITGVFEGTVAYPGVVGASAQPIGSITGSAAAAIEVSGSTSASIGAITGSAQAVVNVSGSSSQSIGNITEVTEGVIGTVTIVGDSNQPVGDITGAITGQVAIDAQSAKLLSQIFGTAVAVVDVTGASSGNVGNVTGLSDADIEVQGSSSQAIGAITGTFVGELGLVPIYAISSAGIGPVTGNASGTVDIAGTSTKSVGAITGSVAGVVFVVASSAKTLPLITGSIVGEVALPYVMEATMTLAAVYTVQIGLAPVHTVKIAKTPVYNAGISGG